MEAGRRGSSEVVIRGAGAPGGEHSATLVLCAGTTLRETLQRCLGESYRWVLAANAPAALRLARAAKSEAIVCEHAPPGVDGLRLASITKSDPSLFTIPVVLVWDGANAADVEHALEIGADDVLSPSLEPSLLRARVRSAVRSRAALRQLVASHAELTRTLQALETSRARTRAIVESAHDGIVVLLPDGRIESTNPAARTALLLPNEPAAVGGLLAAFIADRSRPALEEELARAAGERGPRHSRAALELTGRRADGAEFPLECWVFRVETPSGPRLCAFLRDLTESKRLALELQQAQRLESVGRLAAGLAHELNTPLQFLADNNRFLGDAFGALHRVLGAYGSAAERGAVEPGAAETLAATCQEEDLPYLLEQVPPALASSAEGLERVTAIVRAMKEFAHVDGGGTVAADLNRALEATLEVARQEYAAVADVQTAWGAIPRVVCNAGEMNQVFLNVIVNAAHAVADAMKAAGRRGKIQVVTRKEGDEVVVTIADNGVGISEEIRDRVFDPFFTTREVGCGRGQGLTVARTLVRKHGGRISFESAVGVGTTFEIRLPVEPAAASASSPIGQGLAAPSSPPLPLPEVNER